MASATTSRRSMSWGMGAGSSGGGDDEDLVHVGGDRTGAAALGHPALEQRRAGLDADDAHAASPSGSGSSRTRSPTTTRGVSRFALPAEHRADLAVVRCATRYDRPVPLQHGAEQRRHHSAGARAIASSSAALTSYSDSALSRSSASAAVRPQASVSVSTWPTGRSPAGRPAHEQQRGAVQPAHVGLVLDVDRHRVRLAVAAAEGGRALVLRPCSRPA